MLLPDIVSPKGTCKRFSSLGWQIKRWECLILYVTYISECQHFKKRLFTIFASVKDSVSLMLHRRRNSCFTTWQTASSQANEHLSSISETAALTTSTQFKLKHMKAFVLVIQEVHKHTSLDAEPSVFSPFASEHCMPLSFSFDCMWLFSFLCHIFLHL